MVEISPRFNFKRPYSFLLTVRPLLERLDLFDPERLQRHIRETGQFRKRELAQIIDDAFSQAAQPTNEGVYARYAKHVDLLLPELGKIFEGRIPLFVNGESIAEWDDSQKIQRFPYSPRFLFTSQLLEAYNQSEIPLELLQKIVPIITQPVPFCIKPVREEDSIVLEDYINEQVDSELVKRDDFTPTRGYSNTSPASLCAERAKRNIYALS